MDGREGTVEPGAMLELDFQVKAHTALPRCGVGIKITRYDGLSVYLGASNIEGTLAADVAEGGVIRATIRFQANLLRGTYFVGALLVDTLREWLQIALTGLATFVITETRSVEGCADLNPQYVLNVSTTRVNETLSTV